MQIKKYIAWMILPVCAAYGLYGAPSYMKDDPYANLPRFHFVDKNGKWDNPRNWVEGKVPEGFVRAHIPGGVTVTVDCPVNNSDCIILGEGNTKETTMYIKDRAKMKLSLLFVPSGSQTNSRGTVLMTGGELSVGNDKEGGGLLAIGEGSTYSGTGRVVISGGKFKGGLKIGSVAKNTQKGTLVIEGSKPVIQTNASGNNFMMVRPDGVLEFVLDDDGVSTMNYRGARIYLDNGATVRVDGKNYRRGTKTIKLIEAFKIGNDGARLETVGFSDDYEAKLFIDEDNDSAALILKIISKRR